jgi:steroid delta-isomerase-like uncharacterized protein
MDATESGATPSLRQVASERVDAFNDHDVQAFSDFYADDAVLIAPTFPEPLTSRASIHQNEADFITAVPDVYVEMIEAIVDGRTQVLEVVLRGTHTGPLAGEGGTAPPTGNSVEVPMVLISRFSDDGKITRENRYYDAGAMMRQLGLV